MSRAATTDLSVQYDGGYWIEIPDPTRISAEEISRWIDESVIERTKMTDADFTDEFVPMLRAMAHDQLQRRAGADSTWFWFLPPGMPSDAVAVVKYISSDLGDEELLQELFDGSESATGIRIEAIETQRFGDGTVLSFGTLTEEGVLVYQSVFVTGAGVDRVSMHMMGTNAVVLTHANDQASHLLEGVAQPREARQ